MSNRIDIQNEKSVLEFLKTLKVKFHYENKSYSIAKYNDVYIFNYEVNIQGDLDLSNYKFKEFPIQFNHIEGDFIVAGVGLEKLTGSPKVVTGSFDCSRNKITSVAFGPHNVGGDFLCSYNKVKNLTFKNQTFINGDLDISNNQIETIKRMPEFIAGSINLSNNKIKKLQNFPSDYSGDVNITNNKSITSYKGLPYNSTIII